jgi:uncharacterized protein YndB with AHSA1/START domain
MIVVKRVWMPLASLVLVAVAGDAVPDDAVDRCPARTLVLVAPPGGFHPSHPGNPPARRRFNSDSPRKRALMNARRTKNRTLSDSIRIAAPPDKVWDLITTVAGIAEWYDGWDTVEHDADDQRLQVGTSFRLTRHRSGRDDTAVCRVTSLEAPRRLGWVQYSPHRPAMSVEFRLLPDSDGAAGTLLSHTRSWPEPSL